MNQEKIRLVFFVGLLLGILALVFFIFLPFLSVMVIGVILAVIFHPLYRKICQAVPVEWIAALITVSIVFVVFLAPLSFLGSTVIADASRLYTDITANESGMSLGSYVATFFDKTVRVVVPQASLDINQFTRQILGWLVANIGAVFSSVTQIIVGFLLSMLVFYYALKDGARVKNALVHISPLTDIDDKAILRRIEHAVRSVILGNLVIAFIQGMLVGIGFSIFGVPHGVLWGTIAAVAALVPFIGTSLVVFPAVLYLFFTVGSMQAFGLLLWGATAVGLMDNLLAPHLIGRGVHIHPIFILFSVLGGLSLFGPVGFLIGPLVLSLLFALFDIYQKHFAAQ